MSAGAPLIRFEAVSKRHGAVEAVREVSLDIGAGEFFALLGPSGSGKSSLMRLLAGFEEPDRGQVLLDGENLAGRPPHLRPVNMMFQSYALFPHLDVRGNVAYGLKREGLPTREITARVEEMLGLVGLAGLERRKPSQLSGGERQRVALARALAKRPRVLLLDEPLAALDRRLRQATRLELKAIQARLGTTFLVVTHDQEEALSLADRMGVMRDGRIVQVGSPAEVYRAPVDRFVAAFLGEVNLIEARVEGARRVSSALFPDGLAVAVPGAAAKGSTVWLAIRPEAVRLGREGLAGRIAAQSFLGDHAAYVVALDAGGELKVAAPAGLATGDRVSAALPVDPVVLIR